MTDISVARDGTVKNPEKIVEGATIAVGRRRKTHRLINYVLSLNGRFHAEMPIEIGDMITVQNGNSTYQVFQVRPTSYYSIGVLNLVHEYNVEVANASNSRYGAVGRHIGA